MRSLLLAVGVLVLAGCNPVPVASPEKEEPKPEPKKVEPKKSSGIPEDWTHKELVDHLWKQGAKYKLFATHVGSIAGPAAYLVSTDIYLSEAKMAQDEHRAKSAYVVYCRICKTPQEARDQAGAYGDDAFASGRLLFHAPPAALEKIRQHLP